MPKFKNLTSCLTNLIRKAASRENWMNEGMNPLLAGHGIKDREARRHRVAEVGGNLDNLWDRIDPSAWVPLLLLLHEQPETPPCHFQAILKLPGESQRWIPGECQRCTDAKTTILILISFPWNILSWLYIKKKLMHLLHEQKHTLILLSGAERSGSLHWWHHTSSHQHPRFFLPVWATVHHCLGLYHWCQLAHLLSLWPSPAHLGMHGGRP